MAIFYESQMFFGIFAFFIFGIVFENSPRELFRYVDGILYVIFTYVLCSSIYLLSIDHFLNSSFYNYLLVRDGVTNLISIFLLVGTLLIGFSAWHYNKHLGIPTFEFLFILLILGFNSTLLISSNHLIAAFILIEIQSIGGFILAATNNRSTYSQEAGLKYFILGSFSSITLLLGFSILYVSTTFAYFDELRMILNFFFLASEGGSTDSVMQFGIFIALPLIFIGLVFKLYSAPFHNWLADIYQGASASAVLYLATLNTFLFTYIFLKFFFLLLVDAFTYFQGIVCFFGMVTMFVGAINGVVQKQLKRLIAYGSVTVSGFLLVVLSEFSLYAIFAFFFYLILYVITIFAVISIVCHLQLNSRSYINFIDELENFHILNRPLSFLIAVFFFSLAGIPPFLGFVGKFELLMSIFFSNGMQLFLFALIISIISFYYYVLIVKTVYKKNIKNSFCLAKFGYFNTLVLVSCFLFIITGLVFNSTIYSIVQLIILNLISF